MLHHQEGGEKNFWELILLKFKVIKPKFQKISVVNLNWQILGNLSFICFNNSTFYLYF